MWCVKRHLLFLVVSLAFATNVASAEVINGNPDNYRSLVSKLGVGDVLQLESCIDTQG